MITSPDFFKSVFQLPVYFLRGFASWLFKTFPLDAMVLVVIVYCVFFEPQAFGSLATVVTIFGGLIALFSSLSFFMGDGRGFSLIFWGFVLRIVIYGLIANYLLNAKGQILQSVCTTPLVRNLSICAGQAARTASVASPTPPGKVRSPVTPPGRAGATAVTPARPAPAPVSAAATPSPTAAPADLAWNFDSGLEGWTAVDGDLTAAAGVAWLSPAGASPRIVSPAFPVRQGLFEIDVGMAANCTGRGRLYWTDGTAQFTDQDSLTVVTQGCANCGTAGFFRYRLQLPAATRIGKLALAPCATATPGAVQGRIGFDFVKLAAR